MAHDVFISYSSKDKAKAEVVYRTLKSKAIQCWMAPHDIPSGSSYPKEIVSAIKSAHVFVLIFSANANVSEDIANEVERAASYKREIIPFRIEDVSPRNEMEYFLARRQWLDAFTPPLEQHTNRLAERILFLLGREGEKPAAPPPSAPPRPRPSPQAARTPPWVRRITRFDFGGVFGVGKPKTPPQISKVTNGWGRPVTAADTALVIHGDGFRTGDRVYISNVASGTKLRATWPLGGSKFTVRLSAPLPAGDHTVTVTRAAPDGRVSNAYFCRTASQTSLSNERPLLCLGIISIPLSFLLIPAAPAAWFYANKVLTLLDGGLATSTRRQDIELGRVYAIIGTMCYFLWAAFVIFHAKFFR